MKNLTIQARLTAWYLLSFSIVLGVLAGGSWFVMKSSISRSIDRDLVFQIRTVVSFVQSHSLRTHAQFERLFTSGLDSAMVGVFVQITNNRGEVLYESAVLQSHQVPVLADGPADGAVLLSSAKERVWPVLFAAQRVSVAGSNVTVRVIEPVGDLIGPLRRYQLSLIVLIAVLLPVMSPIGYWLSRRALAPVEQIRRKAEAIDGTDLTTRLQVPGTEDEVARLARTVNGMLTRVDTGFRLIQRFTADASHELRAPLSLIEAAGEMSLRSELTAKELKEYLWKIVGEARHMSNMVEKLLDVAQAEARPCPTKLAPPESCSPPKPRNFTSGSGRPVRAD